MTRPPGGDARPGTPRLLVAVAVQAEAEAVLRGLRDGARPVPLDVGELRRSEHASGTEVDVLVAGVGPTAAAVSVAAVLAAHPYDLVISAGIAGGFVPRAPIAAIVLAEEIVVADLGAQTPEGFRDVTELGFGRIRYTPPSGAVRLAADALDAATGTVLTVSTVTGSAERAAELTARHPHAVAEAMEGYGVSQAAERYGVPMLELRTVSNPVGPRDRAAWRIGEALGALERAFVLLPYRELIQEVAR
ncbi:MULTISPECIES: futalosine hydrolase [unclassified Kitasatospora]|uniref:futalosine hydrolase n=1 Tax=unclassified Kitasatospora TaxID=2633591 RepID=UPI00070D825D|nr:MULTISPECIES: futalosine hydrolase [unclassified Kitasatospora]KQV24145.1 futalosine hydrolase [Kitasatospora sp. Root107]KRB67140.1 futalosine hydrolase [Kitasatospora sp. Root187]